MANFDMGQVLASKWMAKDDVTQQGVELQIVNITEELLGDDQEQKFAMHFNAGYKPLLLNRTNIRIAMSLFGTQTKDWVGKSIHVYQDPSISMAGRLVGGIRLRQAIPAAPRRPAAPVAPPPGWDDMASDTPY